MFVKHGGIRYAHPHVCQQGNVRDDAVAGRTAGAVMSELQPPGADAAPACSSDSLKFVCFDLGGQKFAIPIAEVREVVLPAKITPVVHTPPFVLGIINLRGEIVVVLDVGLFFGLEQVALTPGSRIIVVEREGLVAGLMVARVEKVKELAPETLGPPPITLDSIRSSYIQGVCQMADHPLVVLSLDAVFASAELRALREEADKP